MQLELQQLDLRYERLRSVMPGREQRLMASLAGTGQQVPILVVAGPEPDRFVLIDGRKRVRCLRRLGEDMVVAARLDLDEAEALVLSRSMVSAEAESALEQAWLLDELQSRFGLDQDQLARRFDRTVSWVSRRLGLVRELPESIQQQVRRGEIGAHAAVKYLVPLARAKRADCERLANAVASARLSSREVGLLYKAWRDGSVRTRERLVAEPLVFLQALRQTQTAGDERSPGQRLLDELELLGTVARRARRQLHARLGSGLAPGEDEDLLGCFRHSVEEVNRLERYLEKEVSGAGPQSTNGHPATAPSGAWAADDCPDDEAVAPGGTERGDHGLGGGAAA